MKHLTKRRRSIFGRIFVPIFLLLLLQSMIFISVSYGGGVFTALNENASDILDERVINRKTELETQFNLHWTRMGDYTNTFDRLYATCSSGASNAFVGKPTLQREYLSYAAPTLIAILRQTGVNGVFIILNGADSLQLPAEGETLTRYGLCIRDMDQNSAYTDTEDLLVARAPSSLITDIGCSLDSRWEAQFTFGTAEDENYFFAPLQAAYENPGVDPDDLAYVSAPHHLSENDPEVISYSIPLLDANGVPYGVLGVELTTSYLSSLLPSAELAGQNVGGYAVVQEEEGSGVMTVVAADGVLCTRCLGSGDVFTIGRTLPSGVKTVTGTTGLSVCASISYLDIYNKNTPFESQRVALVGLLEEEELFSFTHRIERTMLLVSALSLLVGLVGILVVSRMIAHPVTRLAKKVRKMEPKPDFRLERLGISEIDQLVDAIEVLSHNVGETQARTEFFSRMSHDMRTPMNAIIGFSSPELLEHAPESVKDDYLEKIHSSGQYLLGLINEVLDITKIDSQKMEIQPNPVSPQDFWDDTLPIVEEVANQKGVTLSVNRENNHAHELILADRQRLQQIFVNLLSNAVKFTPEGGTVSLIVNTLPATCTHHTRKQVVIKDNGIGMSEEFQHKLYQPFEQEHPSKEGTGLGLSIAKKLVELMGGTIQCFSQLGVGTTFIVTLTFPLCSTDTATAVSPAHQELPSAGDIAAVQLDKLSGKHILLCEDHPLNVQIASNLLKKRGMTVDVTENGQEGFKKFTASPPGYYAAILMDIRMPVMNGLETAAAIRALSRPDAASIPIIAMTANAFAEDRSDSAKAGMNAHLSKPVEPQKLYETLTQLIP